MGRWVGWGLLLGSALALFGLSCSGGFDVVGKPKGDSGLEIAGASSVAPPLDIERKPGPDTTPDPAETMVGQFLARVNVTATHSVEFWESEPGHVMLVQTFDETAGERRLELAELLREAQGLYSGLYRTLLNDPSAPLPQQLVEADEHRRHLPIRDASVPLPPDPAPLYPPLTHGAAAVGATPLEPTLPPSATQKTLGLTHKGGGIYGIDPYFCTDVRTDGWCPPGAYFGYVRGTAKETIYWDAQGHNPQAAGGTTDTMTVNRFSFISGWSPWFTYGLWPGHTVEAISIDGSPNTWQGQITGDVVAWAERWRLSFPSVSETTRHPDGAQKPFVNGLNGITHNGNGWIMSRTQGESFWDVYGAERGCVAWFSFATDLQSAGGNRCPGLDSMAFATPPYDPLTTTYCCDMDGGCCDTTDPSCPLICQPPGAKYFNHFGDLVNDAFLPDGWSYNGPLKFGTGNVYVSMNMTGSVNGSIGVISGDLRTPLGYAVLYPNDQIAWVAVDPRTREFYTSNSAGTEIDAWNIVAVPQQPVPTFVPSTGLDSNGAQATWQENIAPLNWAGANNTQGQMNIQGGKVSSHGKLWLWTGDGGGTLVGMDPYSRLVQCTYTFNTGYSEAEGLDITENNVNSPGVGGSIHLQHLSDSGVSGTWQMVNLTVSDPARL
jgi:hypothetical protein